MSKEYWNERKKESLRRTNDILKTLPKFVSSFIKYISQDTSALTRENYTRDIYFFFKYIEDEGEEYGINAKIKDITIDTLSSLSLDFLSSYPDYLESHEDKITKKICTVSDVTRARRLSSVRSLYKYLYISGQIPENQMTKVKSPKLDEKEIIRLEDDESIDFLNTILTGKGIDSEQGKRFNEQQMFRDYTIMAVLLNTGIRVSECVGLDIKDVDTSTSSLRVIRKGHSEYTTLYYNDTLTELLEEYLDERASIKDVKEGSEDALFLSNRKKRIAVRSVEELVKKYTERAGLLKHITPHKLRSTFGTSLYEATGDIRATADALGHKSIETTSRRYVETGKDRRKKMRGAVNIFSESDD